MSILCNLLLTAAMLATPSDTVAVMDATQLIRPEYQGLARKLAVSPAFVPTVGNEFELIRSGPRYGELLFSDFRAATKLIELELFLFGNDPDGERARDILFERVKDGVEVRYTHDSFGNFFDSIFDGRKVFTGFYTNLSRGGIEVRNFSPFTRIDPTLCNPTWRNHRKINIIDKRIAYTGGMNVTVGSISGWGDAMLRITGPAVQSLRSVLLLNWNDLARCKSERDIMTLRVEGEAPDTDGAILQVVADGADQPAFMAEEAIIWMLDHALKYVWFETPYFLPDRPITKALARAVARGVDVSVILPTESDLPALDPAYRSCLEECFRCGVKIFYRKPPFNHSKTVLCDDYLLSVGSTNLDKISLRSLYEVNVYIYDEESALRHRAYLEDSLDGAIVFDQAVIDSWDSKERFLQFVFRIVSPYL